jgi:predicted alpha/beta hydrolase
LRTPDRGNLPAAHGTDEKVRPGLPGVSPLPGRLIAFMVFGVVAGAFIHYRGLTAEGEARVVCTICGAVALAGVVVMLLGWWRQSKRR